MYDYQKMRQELFTPAGLRQFTTTRDKVKELLALAHAVRSDALMGNVDSWFAMACLDYMVECDEIREITGPNTAGQHRVFVAAGTW